MVRTELSKIKRPYELERHMRTDCEFDSDIASEFDPVNKPEHYASGELECIDWIQLALTPEEFKGYLKGCQLKYFWRHELKGKPVQDLEKDIWYVNKLIEVINEEKGAE